MPLEIPFGSPSRARRSAAGTGDRVYAALLFGFGALVLVAAAAIVIALLRQAQPLWSSVHLWDFVKGDDWDPTSDTFGALPFIYGTLLTSALALALAVPISLGLCLFLTELAPKPVRSAVAFGVELLAAIPSVVFGLWGLFSLAPLLREAVEPFLTKTLGQLPFVGALFRGPPLGLGYLAAGLILAIMILPTIAAVAVEVMKTVPQHAREAALALGATRWEVARWSVLPHARAGIFGAALLGLGRALGETMAVTMVIGNAPGIHASLFAPGYTLPSVIANEFAEAVSPAHTAALAALALVLFGITLLLNGVARVLVRRAERGAA